MQTDRQHRCSECSYSTDHMKHFERHQRLHTGEGYQCAHCEKIFTHKSVLNRHLASHTENGVFVCGFCGEKFTRSYNLTRHYQRKHNGRKPTDTLGGKERVKKGSTSRTSSVKKARYVCSFCPYSTADSDCFDDHCRSHTGDEMHTCYRCDKSFSLRAYLLRHVRTIHGPGQLYICNYCGVDFKRSDGLWRHLKTHQKEKPDPLVGKECVKMVVRSENSSETTSDQREARYYCPLCDYSTAHSGSFDNHCRTHTGEKPYACDRCDKAYGTRSDLRRHLRTAHSQEQPFVCDTCGAGFKRSDRLRRHRETHARAKTDPPSEKVKAKKASKIKVRPPPTTITSDLQQTHQSKGTSSTTTDADLQQSNLGKHRCPKCNFSSNRKGEMDNHLRTHTGEKPFCCEYCGDKFAQKSVLYRHRRTHSSHRPFACAICDKKFRRKDNYRAHWKTHGVEGPCEDPVLEKDDVTENSKTPSSVVEGDKEETLVRHRCPECPFSARRRRVFEHHLRLHEEKPFQCELCEEAFAMKSHLRRHVRDHTGGRPFVCGTCDKRFTRRDWLQRHEAFHARKLLKSANTEKDEEDDSSSSSTSSSDEEQPPPPKKKKLPMKKHRCPECSFATDRKPKLDDHMLSHLFAKPFICDHCGLAFARTKFLDSHLATHHDEDGRFDEHKKRQRPD